MFSRRFIEVLRIRIYGMKCDKFTKNYLFLEMNVDFNEKMENCSFVDLNFGSL